MSKISPGYIYDDSFTLRLRCQDVCEYGFCSDEEICRHTDHGAVCDPMEVPSTARNSFTVLTIILVLLNILCWSVLLIIHMWHMICHTIGFIPSLKTINYYYYNKMVISRWTIRYLLVDPIMKFLDQDMYMMKLKIFVYDVKMSAIWVSVRTDSNVSKLRMVLFVLIQRILQKTMALLSNYPLAYCCSFYFNPVASIFITYNLCKFQTQFIQFVNPYHIEFNKPIWVQHVL